MASRTGSELHPAPKNSLRLSVLIPARNEEKNILQTMRLLAEALRTEGIPFEFVVVDDGSSDDTAAVVMAAVVEIPEIVFVSNCAPHGLGRAVRCGLRYFTGDIFALVMADLSDHPDDVVRCYRKIEEGYDCAFGSRFIKGSSVSHYPPVKLVANRIVNKAIQVMFWTHHNDLTNAFKLYRRHVIESIQPLHAAHFNITIELSLSALIRDYRIATLPIGWSGRTWGQSNLRLRQMGRRYLCTLLQLWFERILIADDVMAERHPEA